MTVYVYTFLIDLTPPTVMIVDVESDNEKS